MTTDTTTTTTTATATTTDTTDIMDITRQPETARLVDRLVRVAQQVRAYRNWPECLRIRKDAGRADGPRVLVRFRDGLTLWVRDGTPDIFVVWEVFLAGSYRSAEGLIRAADSPCCVIDLGAHIGSFTLRCARVPAAVEVHSYEPGPDNARMLEANLALSPAAAAKVRVYREAAAGATGEGGYLFDGANPGGSHLCAPGRGHPVPTRAFREIVARCPHPIALLKLDIEGAEYDLLESTDAGDWDRVPAVMAELHADPAGRSGPAAWLERMAGYGFRHQTREFSAILLKKAP